MARVSEIRHRLELPKRKVFATPLRRASVAAACIFAFLALGTFSGLRFVYAAPRTAESPNNMLAGARPLEIRGEWPKEEPGLPKDLVKKKQQCEKAIEAIQREGHFTPDSWSRYSDDFAKIIDLYWKKDYDACLAASVTLKAQVAALIVETEKAAAKYRSDKDKSQTPAPDKRIGPVSRQGSQ